MMKKSNFLILLLLCLPLFSHAQNNECLLINDTFFFITLNIRGNNKNPIIMNGLLNKNAIQNLEKGSVELLLENFYSNAFYIPAIPGGIDKMIFACLKDSTGYQYLKEHANTLAGLLGKIKKKSVSEKFKLKSGETVFVSFTNIGGTFWKVNKEYFGLSADSNEIDIDSINQIQLCFIPFEINYIQKPKRSGYL